MNAHGHFLKYALEMPPTWTAVEMGKEGERIHPKGASGILSQQSSPFWYPAAFRQHRLQSGRVHFKLSSEPKPRLHLKCEDKIPPEKAHILLRQWFCLLL